jgi:hypothetical protein
LCNGRDTRSKHCTQAQPMTAVLTVQLVQLNGRKEMEDLFEGHFTFAWAVLSLTPAHLMASICGDDTRVSER